MVLPEPVCIRSSRTRYQIVSEVAPAPLTVIATDDGGGSRIFSKWFERHYPEERVGKTCVRAVGANESAFQPQLSDTVGGGVEGVAYWCGHRLGYYVAAPQEVQLGSIGPAATLVKCFEVDDKAEVVIVFERTSEHARELFDVWNRLAYGDGGENATVEEINLAAERASGDAQRGYGHRSDRSGLGLRGRLLAHLPGRRRTQLRLVQGAPR